MLTLTLNPDPNRKPDVQIYTNTEVFPYSFPSIGSGADPGVQAVSLQVTLSHPPSGKLPLLSVRPVVTLPAEVRHCPSVGTKFFTVWRQRDMRVSSLLKAYMEADRPIFGPATSWVVSQRSVVKVAFHDTDIDTDTDSPDTPTSLRSTRAISSQGSSSQ